VDATGDRLGVDRIEGRGAEVRKPEREEFGAKLIKRVQATDLKAEVEFDFKAEGLRFHLTATLPGYQKPVDPGDGVHITSSLAG
jgi:two-component sensor histidine kinase